MLRLIMRRGRQLPSRLPQPSKRQVALRIPQEHCVESFMEWVSMAEQLHPSLTSPSTVQSFRCSGRKHATSYVFEGRCANAFDNIVHFYTLRKAQASICWCIFMSLAQQNEGFAVIFRPYRQWLHLDVSCHILGYNLSIYHFVTVPFQVVWEIPVTFLSLSFYTCGLFPSSVNCTAVLDSKNVSGSPLGPVGSVVYPPWTE